MCSHCGKKSQNYRDFLVFNSLIISRRKSFGSRNLWVRGLSWLLLELEGIWCLAETRLRCSFLACNGFSPKQKLTVTRFLPWSWYPVMNTRGIYHRSCYLIQWKSPSRDIQYHRCFFLLFSPVLLVVLSVFCSHTMAASDALSFLKQNMIYHKPTDRWTRWLTSRCLDQPRVLWEPGRHENDRPARSIYDQRTGWLSILGSPRLRHHIDPDSPNYTHTAREQLLARHGLRRQIALSNLLI